MRIMRGWPGSAILVFGMSISLLLAGVSKEVENEYKQQFENKALFLKQPVRGERQTFHLRGQVIVPDTSNLGNTLTFRVGEQVRILEVDFKDSEVEFKVASIDLARRAAIDFDFGQSVSYTFPERPAFDRALAETFTEGLTYNDLDKAKADFVKDQYGRVVNQFADTTGTSTKFVEQTILSAIPEMAQLKKEAQDLRTKLAQTEQDLKEEQNRRQTAEGLAREAKTTLSTVHQNTADLQRRYDEVEAERDRLQGQITSLNGENRKFKEQLDAIARKLDVQMGSNSKLDQQVDKLTQNIDELSSDRTRLSGQVDELNAKVSELTQERAKLTRQLGDAQKKSAKLEGNLRAVTSNRESLEATYLRTKEDKEALERADRLGAGLSLRRPQGGQTEDGVERADIYLLSQLIGSLEVQPPKDPEGIARLVVRTASPNTVQFTDEERTLYEALGSGLKIQPTWRSWSGSLQPVLSSGEAVQVIAPREESDWQWSFRGSPSDNDRLVLDLRILDKDGQSVPLGDYQFQVRGAGWMSLLSGSPYIPGLIGFLLGIALAGIAIALRDRRSSRQRRPARPVSVPSAKEL